MNHRFADLSEVKELRELILTAIDARHTHLNSKIKNSKNNPVIIQLKQDLYLLSNSRLSVSTGTIINFFFSDRLTYRKEFVDTLRKYVNYENQIDTALEFFQKGQLYEESFLYTKALDCFKTAYKFEPGNLEYLKKAAHFMHEFGEEDMSRTLLIKALEEIQRIGNKTDVRLFEIYFELGLTYDHEEKLEQAIDYFDKAIKICEANANKTLDLTYPIYIHLASAYLGINKLLDAEKYIDLAFKKLLGSKNAGRLGLAYKVRAKIALHKGSFKEYRDYLLESLNIFKRLGRPSRYRADTYSEWGVLLMNNAEYIQAISYFEDAMKYDKHLWGEKTIRHIGHYHRISDAFQRMKEFEKARNFAQKAISLCEELDKRNHIVLSAIYNNLALIEWFDNKIDLAKDYWEKDLELQLHHYPANKDGLAITHSNLGFYYTFIKDYETGERKFLNALEITIDLHGENHFLVAELYNRLLTLYKKKGDKKKALKTAEKMIPIMLDHLKTQKVAPEIIDTFNQNMKWLKISIPLINAVS